jgi:hypothetical protein
MGRQRHFAGRFWNWQLPASPLRSRWKLRNPDMQWQAYDKV